MQKFTTPWCKKSRNNSVAEEPQRDDINILFDGSAAAQGALHPP